MGSEMTSHFSFCEKKKVFITRSTYQGSWDNKRCCMDCFGTYTYPDSSEYRGFFRNGDFHGYGRLKLSLPYNFTIQGRYKAGELKNIDRMWFRDGVTISDVKLPDQNGNIDLSNWKYCNKKDRRYVRELVNGLAAVNPMAHITAKKDELFLRKHHYDTEEGDYNANTGFITNRPEPFERVRFVKCEDERKWITDNCRTFKRDPVEMSKEEQHEILENNLSAANKLNKLFHRSEIDPCRNNFYRLCQEDEKADEDIAADNFHSSSSESSGCSSFQVDSHYANLDDICDDEEDVESIEGNLTSAIDVRGGIYDRVSSTLCADFADDDDDDDDDNNDNVDDDDYNSNEPLSLL